MEPTEYKPWAYIPINTVADILSDRMNYPSSPIGRNATKKPSFSIKMLLAKTQDAGKTGCKEPQIWSQVLL